MTVTADIILLAKTERFSQQAKTIAEQLFGDRLVSFLAKVGAPFPDEVAAAQPRFLLSFLSPWIVPPGVLDNSGTALNFHPASIDYPGLGCYNLALYDGASEFGAVCHHMLPKVDSGRIVEERRFPVFDSDTVESLKLRTMVTMLSLFHDICSAIVSDEPLPASDRHWTREAYTRREMNALKTITPDMDPDEVTRRIRASVYPGYPGPRVTIGGHTFYYPVPDRPPLA